MKKTRSRKKGRQSAIGLRKEYRLDYRKARPNRFASSFAEGSRVITLDPDIAQAFTTAESVNTVLRALLETMPAPSKK